MMSALAGASVVVFVTVHLPPSYSWWQSVNATLEQGVPMYPNARLADFNALADANPQWFGSDGVHMPIGGAGRAGDGEPDRLRRSDPCGCDRGSRRTRRTEKRAAARAGVLRR